MLVINDFSPFAEMSEGEFYEYFKDKCDSRTAIKKIYRIEKNKLERVRKAKANNSKRKKAKPNTTTN